MWSLAGFGVTVGFPYPIFGLGHLSEKELKSETWDTPAYLEAASSEQLINTPAFCYRKRMSLCSASV